MAGALGTYDEDSQAYDPVQDQAAAEEQEYAQTGALGGQPYGGQPYGGGYGYGYYDPDAPDVGAGLSSLAGALTGPPEEVRGALDQSKQQVDAATAEKQRLIQNAMARLSQFGQPDPRMAYQAWLNGLVAPGAGGPGATSVGAANAYNAEMAERIRQQKEAQGVATQLGNLDIMQGNTGLQGAQLDYNMLQKRLEIARQADQAAAYARYRQQAAQERAATAQAAQQAALQREQEQTAERAQAAAAAVAERKRQDDLVAQQRADALAQKKAEDDQKAEFSTYIGVDPKTQLPMFANRLGQTKLGDMQIGAKPSAAGGGQGGAFQARYAIASKIYSDPDQAFQAAMGHKSVDPSQVRTAAAKQAADDYRNTPGVPAEPTAAQQWINDRTTFYRQLMAAPQVNTPANPGFPAAAGLPLPGTGGQQVIPPGFNKAFPNAPAPSSVQQPQAPAARAVGAAPPRPPAVPRGAKFSPSTKTWWWQENGVWKTAPAS